MACVKGHQFGPPIRMTLSQAQAKPGVALAAEDGMGARILAIPPFPLSYSDSSLLLGQSHDSNRLFWEHWGKFTKRRPGRGIGAGVGPPEWGRWFETTTTGLSGHLQLCLYYFALCSGWSCFYGARMLCSTFSRVNSGTPGWHSGGLFCYSVIRLPSYSGPGAWDFARSAGRGSSHNSCGRGSSWERTLLLT
jgi:hypothetical protein